MSTSCTKLLRWYDANRRDLPWRAKPGDIIDPYRVWVSEVMLQQTTVATVKSYFVKFLERWPKIEDLAAAELDDILHAWQGLGYYSRARNLHKCALEVVAKWHGKFPKLEAELQSLPGIGPYTAAAVAAIGFGQNAIPVDVNVERVIARLYAIDTPLPKSKSRIRRLAAKLVPPKRPGDFAQALMDFGAIVCRQKKPKCDFCPLKSECLGYKEGKAASLPLRQPKKPRPVRHGTVFWLERSDGAVLVRRRMERGLLGGMMEFPSTPWQETQPDADVLSSHAPCDVHWQKLEGTVEHIFSHFRLVLDVRVAYVATRFAGNHRWCRPADFNQLALPTVMKKVVDHVATAIGNQES